MLSYLGKNTLPRDEEYPDLVERKPATRPPLTARDKRRSFPSLCNHGRQRERALHVAFGDLIPNLCHRLPLRLEKDTAEGQFIYPRGGQIENEDPREQKAQVNAMHYILNTECLTIHFTAHFLLLVNASKHSESEFTFFMSNILTALPSSSLSPVKQTLGGQSVHTVISCDTKP